MIGFIIGATVVTSLGLALYALKDSLGGNRRAG